MHWSARSLRYAANRVTSAPPDEDEARVHGSTEEKKKRKAVRSAQVQKNRKILCPSEKEAVNLQPILNEDRKHKYAKASGHRLNPKPQAYMQT